MRDLWLCGHEEQGCDAWHWMTSRRHRWLRPRHSLPSRVTGGGERDLWLRRQVAEHGCETRDKGKTTRKILLTKAQTLPSGATGGGEMDLQLCRQVEQECEAWPWSLGEKGMTSGRHLVGTRVMGSAIILDDWPGWWDSHSQAYAWGCRGDRGKEKDIWKGTVLLRPDSDDRQRWGHLRLCRQGEGMCAMWHLEDAGAKQKRRLSIRHLYVWVSQSNIIVVIDYRLR